MPGAGGAAAACRSEPGGLAAECAFQLVLMPHTQHCLYTGAGRWHIQRCPSQCQLSWMRPGCLQVLRELTVALDVQFVQLLWQAVTEFRSLPRLEVKAGVYFRTKEGVTIQCRLQGSYPVLASMQLAGIRHVGLTAAVQLPQLTELRVERAASMEVAAPLPKLQALAISVGDAVRLDAALPALTSPTVNFLAEARDGSRALRARWADMPALAELGLIRSLHLEGLDSLEGISTLSALEPLEWSWGSEAGNEAVARLLALPPPALRSL